MSEKRMRGRPVGTGIDDAPMLRRIADLIVRQPGLRPTTAFKQCQKRPSQSQVRRIQDKWRKGNAHFLAEAEARLATERQAQLGARQLIARSRQSTVFDPFGPLDALSERVRQLTATAQFAKAFELATRTSSDSLLNRLTRQIHGGSYARAVRGWENSSYLRAVRAFENSPLTRLTRQLEENQRRIDAMLGVHRF